MTSWQSTSLFQAGKRIVETLRAAGYEALFAGGCVRDFLLQVQPYDIDIATSATPADIINLFPRTVPVGAQFGVVIVLHGRFEFQVATFRTDSTYHDGRHPDSVQFSTPQEDAQRRDFTVNGLFFDPITNQIHDYVGGQTDLQNRLLRAIGDPNKRFEEDKLRILRAVRFATQLDFTIDPPTWDALKQRVSSIHQVSAERIRDELNKLFLLPRRAIGLDLLDASGLLKEILPEILPMKGCEQPPEFHPEGDVFVHTRAMLGMLKPNPSVPLVWSTLLHDVGKPPTQTRDPNGRIRFNGHERVGADMTRSILERLRFSNHDTEATVEAVRQHMAFKDVQNMRIAKLKRFMARPNFDDELELHRVDCTSSHGLLDNYDFLLHRREEFASEPIIPPPLITGRDLIQLGWKPGPAFKETLESVQTLQLEGQLKSREQALEWIRHREKT